MQNELREDYTVRIIKNKAFSEEYPDQEYINYVYTSFDMVLKSGYNNPILNYGLVRTILAKLNRIIREGLGAGSFIHNTTLDEMVQRANSLEEKIDFKDHAISGAPVHFWIRLLLDFLSVEDFTDVLASGSDLWMIPEDVYLRTRSQTEEEAVEKHKENFSKRITKYLQRIEDDHTEEDNQEDDHPEEHNKEKQPDIEYWKVLKDGELFTNYIKSEAHAIAHIEDAIERGYNGEFELYPMTTDDQLYVP